MIDADDRKPWTATATWRAALKQVREHGGLAVPESAGAAWRGRTTSELIGFQSVWPMASPVIVEPARKLGYRFMAAEAAWILSGDNRVETIKPFAKDIAQFSDDGQRFFGAYGPKFIDQLSYVVQTLFKDPASRQAVINIWREQPRESRDTPCTLSWQFLIRERTLHCVATMRSSDLWTGIPYDVVNFSTVAAVVALELRGRGALWTKLGNLYLTAGSQHLYEADWPAVDAILAAPVERLGKAPAPLDLAEFADASDLVRHLWALARKDPDLHKHRFMREVFP